MTSPTFMSLAASRPRGPPGTADPILTCAWQTPETPMDPETIQMDGWSAISDLSGTCRKEVPCPLLAGWGRAGAACIGMERQQGARGRTSPPRDLNQLSSSSSLLGLASRRELPSCHTAVEASPLGRPENDPLSRHLPINELFRRSLPSCCGWRLDRGLSFTTRVLVIVVGQCSVPRGWCRT